MCEALTFLLDNIYIRFGSKLYRQIVGIPMGTNCAPLVADLFMFCFERDFLLSLSDDNQSEVIKVFNFWPGFGFPRPKAIVVIPKNQLLSKPLTKKK